MTHQPKTPPIPDDPHFRMSRDFGPEYLISEGWNSNDLMWVGIRDIVERGSAKIGRYRRQQIANDAEGAWRRKAEKTLGEALKHFPSPVNFKGPTYDYDKKRYNELSSETNQMYRNALAWRAWGEALLKGVSTNADAP